MGAYICHVEVNDTFPYPAYWADGPLTNSETGQPISALVLIDRQRILISRVVSPDRVWEELGLVMRDAQRVMSGVMRQRSRE